MRMHASSPLRHRALMLCAALALAGLSACKDNPGTTDTPVDPGSTSSWKAPGQGSTYDMATWKLTADRLPTGDSTALTYTVAATGLTFGGRSGVTRFVSPADTINLIYESNGDLSFYLEPWDDGLRGMAAQWVRIPVATGSANADTLADVKNYYAENSSVGVPMKLIGTFELNGDGMVIINGATLPFRQICLRIKRYEGSILYQMRFTWTIVPRIGFFSYVEFMNEGWSMFGIERPGGGYVRTLDRSVLK